MIAKLVLSFVGLFWMLTIVASVALPIVAAVAAVHFIAKFW